jgi:hypothetical protein
MQAAKRLRARKGSCGCGLVLGTEYYTPAPGVNAQRSRDQPNTKSDGCAYRDGTGSSIETRRKRAGKVGGNA